MFYDDAMDPVMDRMDAEIAATLGEEWETLKAQDEGWVARHTVIVLAMVVTDPIYEQVSAEEKNILKWAAMLHDLAKVQAPTI